MRAEHGCPGGGDGQEVVRALRESRLGEDGPQDGEERQCLRPNGGLIGNLITNLLETVNKSNYELVKN